MKPTSVTPLNARHARQIVRANGAPKGERRTRQEELKGSLCLQMRRELGLRPIRPRGVRWRA